MEQNVGKRLAAGFTPGLKIYGMPTMTNTALNVQTDMASDMNANTAANKSVQMRANMATSSAIDGSSDDHRSGYSLIQCLHAFVNRMHLLGELVIFCGPLLDIRVVFRSSAKSILHTSW